MGRLARREGAQQRLGLREIASLTQRDGKVHRVRGDLRLDRPRGLKELDGAVDIAAFAQHRAEIAEGGRIAGFERERVAVGRRRLRRAPRALQGHPQRKVGVERPGLGCGRASIRIRRFVPALERLQHLTESELVAEIARIGCRRARNVLERGIEPLLLQLEDP